MARTPRIYTKTGDKGRTSLVGGTKVPKTDPRLESYGTVDELNSFLGLLRSEIQTDPRLMTLQEPRFLETLQNLLFNMGSHLACEDPELRKSLPTISSTSVQMVEAQIDALTSELTPLKSFILPGGTTPTALAHVCRSVCRRAERATCHLAEEATPDPEILILLNRLSDYFFVLARWLSLKAGAPDQVWTKDPDGNL